MHRTRQDRFMGAPRIIALVYCACLVSWAAAAGYSQSTGIQSPNQKQQAAGGQASGKEAPIGGPALPRGKKLVLRDGSFQLVRDYQRKGERVRSLSAERGGGKEIPAAMVDWDATANAAAA